MSRASIKTTTIKRLFALSGNQCAFPGCEQPLIDSDDELVCEICHIEAASKGGQRYNPLQTEEQRSGADNLILFCYLHHKKTDNVLKYPVPVLKKIKAEHEAQFAHNPYSVPADIEGKIIAEVVSKLEQLYVLSEKTHQLVEEGNRIGQENSEKLTEIFMAVRSLQAASPIPTDDSKIYSEQLAFVKRFREAKQPQTGLNFLLQFKQENWDKIDDELRFKVLANLGGLLFELGRKAEGAEYLVSLKDVPFESADSLARLCLGYSILGRKDDFDTVFSKAVKIAPDNINLWIAYIHIQPDDTPANAIEEAIPESLLEKSEILFALGEALIDRGEEAKGFEMLDKSLALSGSGLEENWQVLGIVESKKLLHIATLEKIALRQFTEAELAQIKASGETLQRIWAYVSGTEYAAGAWHIVMNLGITQKILGNNIQAEADLAEAWRISKSFFAFKNLLLQYIETGKLKEAQFLTDEAAKSDFDSADAAEVVKCYARLRTAQNNIEEAVNYVLERLPEFEAIDRLSLLDLVALIYFQAGTFGKALPFAMQMIAEFPDAPEGHLAAGIAQRRLNEPENAIANFESAEAKISTALNATMIWFQLGIEYGDMGRHEKAAACLEHIALEGRFDVAHRKLAHEYYDAGAFQKAIRLCERGVAINAADAAANEILYRAYYEIGKSEEAEALFERYLTVGAPDSFDHFRYLSATFHQKRGEHELAAQQLLQIEHINRLNLSHRITIARILLHSGHLPQGMDVAFNVRADFYDDVKVHEAYMQLLWTSPPGEESFRFPGEVSMDCAVVLRDESGTDSKFLLSDDKRLNGKEVLRQSDKITQSLLGKKFGETITIPNKVGVGNVLTIVSIESKYVYALQESMRLLETRFSGETSIIVFNTGDSCDISPIKNFIAKQSADTHSTAKEAFKLYDNDMCTIGALSSYFRRNFIETWYGLITTDDTCIRCYSHDESGDIVAAVELERPIIVEPIALLTSQILLQDHKLLEGLDFKFIVAQSTIAELRHYRQELDLPRPKITVGMQDGELRKHEWTEEQNEHQRLLADSLIHWCENGATIMSPAHPPKSNNDDELDIVSIMGKAFNDSMLLANELNGTLLSDDERLKALALGEYGLPSFSCYQLAFHKYSLGQISSEKMSAISKTLASANYAYLPLPASDLWDLFEQSSYQIRPPFTRAARGARNMTVPFCATTLALFAKQLYLNVVMDVTRQNAMLLLLSEAKFNPAFHAIRNLLGLIIVREFRLMPNQRQELLALLETLPASVSR